MNRASSAFTVTAPGSLMLMGEHAVLHGQPALCMAVEPRVTVTVRPRPDREIHISSSLGSLHASLDCLPDTHDLRFVLACLQDQSLKHGLEADIHSELDATRGLGTSAAVTVAMTAALLELAGRPFDPSGILNHSLQAIRQVQGCGSGCDAAASTFGGIVRVSPDPLQVEPMQAGAEFWTSYVGYKTPTPEVIARVETLRGQAPEVYGHLFSAMGLCVDQSVSAIRGGDWEQVGRLMIRHHYLQAALGTSDPNLDTLVTRFLKMPGILGAKISGSGLGDSVLALGKADPAADDPTLTPITVSGKGVTLAHERS
jgi:mevalonate kinase